MAKKTGFERMTEHMFGGGFQGVPVATPAGDGSRMSREERRSLEAGWSPSPGAGGGGGEGPRRGPGRPRGPECDWVTMNFRVDVSFRQRVKKLAADLDVSVNDLFKEGFDYVFRKYSGK